MEALLSKVIQFADTAHGDQVRRYTGERYIVHPERVMKLLREYTDDVTILSAAILHDVLEDTPTTREEIFEFLKSLMGASRARHTTQLVVELTDIYVKEKFPKLNRKQRKTKEAERLGKTSAEAQTIKYADLIDNALDISQNDKDFAPGFLKECQMMLVKMDKGNYELYKRTELTLNTCLKEFESEL
ncbi:MAG TPA: HD domain-containing protein [Cytophagaceae bacterium]